LREFRPVSSITTRKSTKAPECLPTTLTKNLSANMLHNPGKQFNLAPLSSGTRNGEYYIIHLLPTVSGLAKVAIFTTNVDAENQTLINHKCVCGALNLHFCQTRVMQSAFYFFLIFDIVCPIDFVGLSISLIAKSMASCINAFTFTFL